MHQQYQEDEFENYNVQNYHFLQDDEEKQYEADLKSFEQSHPLTTVSSEARLRNPRNAPPTAQRKL